MNVSLHLKPRKFSSLVSKQTKTDSSLIYCLCHHNICSEVCHCAWLNSHAMSLSNMVSPEDHSRSPGHPWGRQGSSNCYPMYPIGWVGRWVCPFVLWNIQEVCDCLS